jgi:transposase InsO family protein
MTSRLAVDALDMAPHRRPPEGGLPAHPGRGSQYASGHCRRLLEKHGIGCGVSGVAQCRDNAPVESFFASLKRGLVHRERYITREQAKASTFVYVEAFYNRVRRHSSLGYVSPGSSSARTTRPLLILQRRLSWSSSPEQFRPACRVAPLRWPHLLVQVAWGSRPYRSFRPARRPPRRPERTAERTPPGRRAPASRVGAPRCRPAPIAPATPRPPPRRWTARR